MASLAPTPRHPPVKATNSARPSLQDPNSRIPSKSALPTSSRPKPGASPSIGTPKGNFGYTTASSGRSKDIGFNTRNDNGAALMNVAQRSITVPTRVDQSAPPSPQHLPVPVESHSPSPSSDTPPPPSLVSGSSISSNDSPRSNKLRRKPSVIGKYVSDRQQGHKESTFEKPLLERFDSRNDASTQRSVGLAKPVIDESSGNSDTRPKIARVMTQEPVELRYGADGHVIRHHTPLSEPSTTPSIPRSSSPSQFSQSTAPTSLTSSSPALGFSPQIGMQSFTSLPKTTSPRPNEPIGHPFFRQASQTSKPSLKSPPRPKTAPEAPSSPTKPRIRQAPQSSRIESKINNSDPVHPPELAYLSSATRPVPDGASTAPRRPSRDGTPNLNDQKKPQPVVQSGLPRLNTFQHRRKQSDTSLAASGIDTTPRLTPVSGQHTVLSPQDSSPDDDYLPVRNTSKMTLQEALASTNDMVVAPEPKTPDTSSKQKSRFGFFSRKPKSDSDHSKENTKQNRKGPAAGTGHEGYGKHVMRARSGSASSTGTTATGRPVATKRKDSHGSNGSKASDLDDFLQQRLSPVYLRGEGKDSESQGRTSGSAFEAPSVFTPSHSSRQTSHTSASSFDMPKSLADASSQLQHITAGPSEHSEKPPSRGRDSKEQFLGPPTATKSRSPSRKRLAKPRPVPKESALKQVEVTSPVVKDEVPPRPSVSGSSVTPSRKDTDAESLLKAKKSHWSLFPKSANSSKPPSKWTFLSRSKPAESSEQHSAERSSRDSVSAPQNPPAHYLSTDENAVTDIGDLDDIMREATQRADDASSTCTDFEDTEDYVAIQTETSKQIRLSSSGRPSQPAVTANQQRPAPADMIPGEAISPSNNVTTTQQNALAMGNSKPRRLNPVGRIPPVAPRNGQPHRPPPLSFSRPFAQASPKPDVYSPPASATSSLFPPTAQQAQASKASSSEADLPSLKLKTTPNDLAAPAPFIDFPARKNSDNSYSSSAGTMHFPTASTIAHGPGRNSRASNDETWPEFDDLIDHVLTPSPSASSHQSKQYFENRESAHRSSVEAPTARAKYPKLGTVEAFPLPTESSGKSPTKTSVEVDTPTAPVGSIAAALRDPPSSSTIKSRRSNSICNSYNSSESSRASLKHRRSNSLPQAGVASKDQSRESLNEAIIHKNPYMFRYRVLMTSKWLSFGRLLFSPIHNELGNPADRVLVIDGLGNRDWSYYCAVSYPQTQIYSLGPSAPSSNNGRASLGNFGNLPNYRHFCYTTPGTDFPFPKGFFASVVYRFPVANSDAVMRAMVSECKRVLRPGGYLEVSSIDLDLANMGSKTRRAVRNLKTDMRNYDGSVSLKAASDHVQGLIGRRGFENLNRCIVGVPAAGVIASSRENSQDENEVDFTKLASDNSKEGDDHITKMVAQVGRWWYTQCYEMNVLPNKDPTKSMWCNRNLLRECEEQNTTFRLLICYAQKPSCAKRRTVSL